MDRELSASFSGKNKSGMFWQCCSQHMPGQDLLKETEYRKNNTDSILFLGKKPTET